MTKIKYKALYDMFIAKKVWCLIFILSVTLITTKSCVNFLNGATVVRRIVKRGKVTAQSTKNLRPTKDY